MDQSRKPSMQPGIYQSDMVVQPQPAHPFPPTTSVSEPTIKRRKRITTTCINCRSRKIKCDQGRPCSSCTKKKIPPHLCIYEESPFIPTPEKAKSGDEAILLLKKENEQLKRELALLKRHTSTDMISPPLSEASTIQTGNQLKPLKRFESVHIKPNRLTYYGPTSWRPIVESQYNEQEVLCKVTSYLSNARKDWKVKHGLAYISPQEYVDTETPYPEKLLPNLSDYIPPFDVVKDYLEIFSESFWAYDVNIVEFTTLMNDFLTLFRRDEATGRCHIRVYAKTVDYAKVALIIMVLKVSILNTSTTKETFFDDKNRLQHYADRLLRFSKADIRATIPAIQTLIIMHRMKRVNPLDGDGGDGSNGTLLLKKAISMAMVVGLHRDIDQLYKMETVLTRETYKRIWKYLYQQDVIASFYMGFPMSINDNYIYAPTITEDMSERMRLTRVMKEAVHLMLGNKPVTAADVHAVITKLDTFDDGAPVTITETIRTLNTPDEVVNGFHVVRGICDRIYGLFTLHVLWQVLMEGLEGDDPYRRICGIFARKYSVLCITHFIEIQYRLNKMCFTVAAQNDARKLYKIVDCMTSVIGVSKLVFIWAISNLFISEIRLQHNKEKQADSFDPEIKFNVDVVETMDPHNDADPLVVAMGSTAFGQGLVELACKHLLHLQSTSFARVLSFNFCLHGIIASYKYFGAFLESNLPPDEVERRKKIRDTVRYNGSPPAPLSSISSVREPPVSSVREERSVGPCQLPSLSSFSHPSPFTSIQPQPSLSATPTLPVPSLSTNSEATDLTDANLNFDFFEFNDDAVERLFANILSDDEYLRNIDKQLQPNVDYM